MFSYLIRLIYRKGRTGGRSWDFAIALQVTRTCIKSVAHLFKTIYNKNSAVTWEGELGVEDYLIKPFMLQALMEILHGILQGSAEIEDL